MRRLALLASLVAVAGCGGGDDGAKPKPRAAAGPTAEEVVRGWSEDLRRGDIDAATARFAVPAIVANGTPQVRLETRAEVFFFNDTLPCGGRVVKTERRDGLLVATFELTDRVGGDCGPGAGHRAKTAFEVRRGKIVRWLRVPMKGEDPGVAPKDPVV